MGRGEGELDPEDEEGKWRQRDRKGDSKQYKGRRDRKKDGLNDST